MFVLSAPLWLNKLLLNRRGTEKVGASASELFNFEF